MVILIGSRVCEVLAVNCDYVLCVFNRILQFALTNLQEGEEVGVNYAALDFPSRTAKR